MIKNKNLVIEAPKAPNEFLNKFPNSFDRKTFDKVNKNYAGS